MEESGNSSKKRGADKQFRKEELDEIDNEVSQENDGTWKVADQSTISTRRKVKVRRGNGLVPENLNQQTTDSTPVVSVESNNSTISSFTLPKSDEHNNGIEKKENVISSSLKTPEKKIEFSEVIKKPESLIESPKDTKTTTTTTSAPFTFTPWTPVGGSMNFADLSNKGATPSWASGGASLFDFSKRTDDENSEGADVETNIEITPKANLPPPEPVKTGEEDEKNVFTCKVKCYEFDITEKKYKERGAGLLKVNTSEDGKNSRVLMRTDATGRLIVNCPILSVTKIDKHGDKAVLFFGFNYETKTPTQYSFRAIDPNVQPQLKATELLDVLNKQKSNAKASSPSTNSKDGNGKAN